MGLPDSTHSYVATAGRDSVQAAPDALSHEEDRHDVGGTRSRADRHRRLGDLETARTCDWETSVTSRSGGQARPAERALPVLACRGAISATSPLTISSAMEREPRRATYRGKRLEHVGISSSSSQQDQLGQGGAQQEVEPGAAELFEDDGGTSARPPPAPPSSSGTRRSSGATCSHSSVHSDRRSRVRIHGAHGPPRGRHVRDDGRDGVAQHLPYFAHRARQCLRHSTAMPRRIAPGRLQRLDRRIGEKIGVLDLADGAVDLQQDTSSQRRRVRCPPPGRTDVAGRRPARSSASDGTAPSTSRTRPSSTAM